MRPDISSKEKMASSLNDSEIFKFLNLKLSYVEDEIHLRLDPIEARHRGGSTGKSVNGAIIAAITDIAVGATIPMAAHAVALGSGVGRLNIKMRKPIEGNHFMAVARIEDTQKNLIYVSVRFLNEAGTLCVEAQGTVFVK